MAKSGSYDFSLNRDGIIRKAMTQLQLVKPNSNPPSDWVTDAAETLNVMIKVWQAEGIGLWLNKKFTLFLQYEQQSYDLGPTGDHATLSYNYTTLSSAAASAASTIVVSSATGITDTYAIGVELDSGTMQWTTVNGAPSSTTVTLTAALTGAAASGNTVYVYETIIQRPLEVWEPRTLESSSDDETNINIVSREEYMAMTDKDNTGRPNMAYYDPQLTDGKLYVWPAPDTVDTVLVATAKYPIQDFDAAANDADFPVEWTEALVWNLAMRIAPAHMDDIMTDRIPLIEKYARESKENAMRFDSEHGTSIFFQPEIRQDW